MLFEFSVLSEYLETVGYLSHLQRKLLQEHEEILLDKIRNNSGNFTLYMERTMQIFSKQFNNTRFVQHGFLNPTIYGKYYFRPQVKVSVNLSIVSGELCTFYVVFTLCRYQLRPVLSQQPGVSLLPPDW